MRPVAFCAVALACLAGGVLAKPAVASSLCAATAVQLAQKVEADYARVPIERMTGRAAYTDVKRRMFRAAANASTEDACYWALEPYVSFFGDGHVFLIENPDLSQGEVARLQAAVPHDEITEDEVKAAVRRETAPDQIEGVWYEKDYRVGIVSDGGGRFSATVLSSNSPAVKPGEVKARFVKNRDGTYRAIVYSDVAKLPRHATGSIFRNGTILSVPPLDWARVWPAPPPVPGFASDDPMKPVFSRFDGRTVVISIPSHDPQYTDALTELVKEHAGDLESATLLIIDVRGDSGGSSTTTSALTPYLVSRDMRPRIGPAPPPVILSSPDLIAFFSDQLRNLGQSSYARAIASALEQMKAHPGALVPLAIGDDQDVPTEPAANAKSAPPHVAFLVDGGDASAAEADVLAAHRYKRVTVFGTNTSGTIDYESVAIFPLKASGPYGFMIGLPTIAASASLPTGGFLGHGIPPDVLVPGGADPYRFVVNYYGSGS